MLLKQNRYLLSLPICLLSMLFLVFLHKIQDFPSVFLADDAYFYLEIARNFSSLGFPTFDGINATNGFHPLNMFFLSSVFYLLGLGDVSDVYSLGVLSTVYGLIVAVISWALSSQPYVFIAIFLTSIVGTFFMEPWIAFLPFVFLKLNKVVVQDVGHLSLALVSLFLVMARIDYVIVSVVCILYLSSIGEFRKSITVFVSALIGIIFTLAINDHFGGNIFSVSSMVKQGWVLHGGLLGHLKQNLSSELNVFKYCIVVALLILQSKKIVMGIRQGKVFLIELFFTGGCLFLICHSFASHLRPWYFWLPIASGLSSLFRSRQLEGVNSFSVRLNNLILFLYIGVVYLFLTYAQYHIYRVPQKDTANFLKFAQQDCLKNKRSYWQYDGSGYIGYWLDCPVVNGDGLVNSLSYYKILSSPDLLHKYVIDNGFSIISNRSHRGIYDDWDTSKMKEIYKASNNQEFTDWLLLVR